MKLFRTIKCFVITESDRMNAKWARSVNKNQPTFGFHIFGFVAMFSICTTHFTLKCPMYSKLIIDEEDFSRKSTAKYIHLQGFSFLLWYILNGNYWSFSHSNTHSHSRTFANKFLHRRCFDGLCGNSFLQRTKTTVTHTNHVIFNFFFHV